MLRRGGPRALLPPPATPAGGRAVVACLVLFACAAVPARAAAQQGCPASLTIGECYGVLLETSAQERGVRLAERTLAEKSTGAGSSMGPGLTSALEDFLPVLAGGVSLPTAGDDGPGFGVDWNLPLYRRPHRAPPTLDLGGNLRVRAQSRESPPFRRLIEALPSASRAEARESLEERIDHADDVEVELAWNRESATVGRSFAGMSDLTDDLLDEAADLHEGLRPSVSDWAIDNRDRIRANVATGPDGDPVCDAQDLASIPNIRLECLERDFRREVVEELRALAGGRAGYLAAIQATLDSAGYFRLAELVNNQPQLTVSVTAKLRDEAVGADEYGLRVRYEKGFENVNRLRDVCGGSADDGVTLDCLDRYLDRPGTRSSLQRGDRAWASLEVEIVDAYGFDGTLVAQPVSLRIQESVSVNLGVGYGRYLAVDDQGDETARLDASLEVELNEGVSQRPDRVVGSLTYTQKITDDVSLPLGVTFANKPEFLGGVDDRLGLNVGVRYKLRRDR